MKFVDEIIKDIPYCEIEKADSEYHNEMKYCVDTRELLEGLKKYEVEIPLSYYKEYEGHFGNGVLQYLSKLTNTDIDDMQGNNTYNYGGRVVHDLDYRYSDKKTDDDTFYVAIQVHRSGDIRGNYTDFALFEFESYEDFLTTLDDLSKEQGGVLEYNGKHYFYDMSVLSEYVNVWCQEDESEFDEVITDDEELKKAIDEYEK